MGDKKNIGKYPVETIVKIKRLLAGFDTDKKLSHQKISDLVGVSRSTVQLISAGKTYKDIEIDEEGNLIEEEIVILPEHFRIPKDAFVGEIVEEKPLIKDEKTLKFRNEFIEKYFKREVKTGKVFMIRLSSDIPFINNLYKRRSFLFQDGYEEFISEVAKLVTEAVYEFEPDFKDFKWENTFIDETKESEKIHKYINVFVERGIKKYANEINDSHKVIIDGKVGYMKANVESLDVVASTAEGDFPLIEEMGDASNHFVLNSGYTGSHFLDWFSNEFEKKLSRDEIIFLRTMVFFQRDSANIANDYVRAYRDIPKEYQPYPEGTISTIRKRIKDKTEDEYSKVEKKTLRQMNYERELKFWKSLIEVIEIKDEEIDKQNALISKWIKKRLKNEFMADLFFQLDVDDVLSFRNDELIRAQTIYKVVCYAEARVEHLNKIDEKIVPFYRKEDEYFGLSKEEYRKLQNERIIKDKLNKAGDKRDYRNFRVLTSGKVAEIDE